MAEQSRTAVVTDLVDSFSTNDLERVRSLLDENVVYEETGTGRRVEGAEEYLELLRGWKQAFPDASGTVTAELESGDQAAVEVTWVGTHTGPLATPGGEVPASDKSVEIRASLWCSFEGGKIKDIRNHLDILALLQQVGAIPSM